jgi:hypothetical protein
MVSDTAIFVVGLFATLIVAAWFGLSGLEMRRLGERAERRRAEAGRAGAAPPEMET